MSKSISPPVIPLGGSAKDKRYFQQVEKVLLSFDSIEEWADYIAFLSRLQKSLQLNELKVSSPSLPFPSQIAHKLSLCLSSNLPNGVHQKTLSLYDSIFTAMPAATLELQINIWLPGLLPLFSYCSIQIKPLLLQLFMNHILGKLSLKIIRLITKPLILSFLPGLDDEGSETFGDFLSILDLLKKRCSDDQHFWQSFFFCVIDNPERRLGALYWCNKRLPVFTKFKGGEGSGFSEEAAACISPEPGLLIRAFASSITSTVSMIAANDIIVIRGFFDLLLSHLPLDSDVITSVALKRDVELLVVSCCSITLKKDMSLNRRLWNWLLGPDNEHSNSTVPASPTSEKKSVKDTDTTGGKISRSEYFKKYSLPTVSIILLDQIQNNPTQSIDQYVSVFKISLSLILDKWEISRALSPVLFLPIMRATHQCKLKKEVKDSDALLTAASSFFDTVEAMYIWNDLNRLICANDEMELVAFIVSNFDLNEEEMKEIHIPLGVVCLQKNKLDSKWFSILEILLQNINLESTIGAKPTSITSDISSSDILTYYDSLLSNHSTPPPYTPEVISQYIVSTFKSIVISSLNNSDYSISSKLCDLYVQLITVDSDKKLIEKMLNTPETDYSSSFDGKANLFSAFNLVKLLSVVHGSLSPMEKDKILKIIMNNYYYSLISQYPVNFQVEVVKSIFQLDKFYLKYQIEASILKLFIGTSSIIERIRALNNLWNHSSNHNDDDTILARPLFLILDELKAEEDELVVARFISSNVLKGGSSNRLLKLLTNPLLGFDFISDTNNVLKIDDDLGQFSYYLSTIVNVIKTNEKHLKESFNNELVVMDSTNKLHAITANSWDVSTYKSLLLNVIEKFLSLKLSDDILRNENDKYCNQFKGRYYQTISGCLKLYCLLITGNEVDFIKKFHSLIVNSSNIIDASTNDKSGFLEVVTDKYINCITVLLRVSEGQHVNLNLLHIEDKEKDPQLIKLMVIGIKNAQTVVLLESWTTLLTRTLYLFNESVFSVLLTLNDTLVFRIEDLFRQIKNKSDDENKKINYLHDIESSINVLAGGIEDLLTISHSYLLTSNLRARGDLNGSGGNSNGPNGSSNGATSNSSGFFGNVIQGVFLIESPAIRTTEENKKYSILLAFQDAISVGSKIWMWAETSGTSTDNRTNTGIYLSRKLKFKARKLLETLIEIERQEVIESLISLNCQYYLKETTKLLHVLDGGRSQVTLPNIYNSILTRCYPSVLDEKQKSTMNSEISVKTLGKFLLQYVESIDNDSISDIWTFTFQFFKEVIAHPSNFKVILPDLLKTLTNLMCKLSNTKFGEQGRSKKDLGDIFMKLLMIAVRGELVNEEKTISDPEKVTIGEDSNLTPILKENAIATQSSLLDTLTLILTRLNEFITDLDKITSCINTILVNLVSPQIKNKKINEIPSQTISLILLIGENYPTKSWRSTVLDCFMDNSFFKTSAAYLSQWEEIIQIWINNDKEKMGELISKVNPIITSAAANIFNWSENSEIENKIFNLKRIVFFILIQQKDFFLNNLEELISRVESTLNTNGNDSIICPPLYRSEILLLLRIITLKFSELHLLSHWTSIGYEILTDFKELIEIKNSKEILQLSSQELKLILFNCKLLDQLLLLKYDEFNLNEWLYVNSSPEVVTSSITNSKKSTDSISLVFSCIDRISEEKEILASSKEPAIKINTIDEDSQYVSPLLTGINKVDSLSSLRLFFSSLSLLHYERTYGLKIADIKICEDDILNDIISE